MSNTTSSSSNGSSGSQQHNKVLFKADRSLRAQEIEFLMMHLESRKASGGGPIEAFKQLIREDKPVRKQHLLVQYESAETVGEMLRRRFVSYKTYLLRVMPFVAYTSVCKREHAIRMNECYEIDPTRMLVRCLDHQIEELALILSKSPESTVNSLAKSRLDSAMYHVAFSGPFSLGPHATSIQFFRSYRTNTYVVSGPSDLNRRDMKKKLQMICEVFVKENPSIEACWVDNWGPYLIVEFDKPVERFEHEFLDHEFFAEYLHNYELISIGGGGSCSVITDDHDETTFEVDNNNSRSKITVEIETQTEDFEQDGATASSKTQQITNSVHATTQTECLNQVDQFAQTELVDETDEANTKEKINVDSPPPSEPCHEQQTTTTSNGHQEKLAQNLLMLASQAVNATTTSCSDAFKSSYNEEETQFSKRPEAGKFFENLAILPTATSTTSLPPFFSVTTMNELVSPPEPSPPMNKKKAKRKRKQNQLLQININNNQAAAATTSTTSPASQLNNHQKQQSSEVINSSSPDTILLVNSQINISSGEQQQQPMMIDDQEATNATSCDKVKPNIIAKTVNGPTSRVQKESPPITDAVISNPPPQPPIPNVVAPPTITNTPQTSSIQITKSNNNNNNQTSNDSQSKENTNPVKEEKTINSIKSPTTLPLPAVVPNGAFKQQTEQLLIKPPLVEPIPKLMDFTAVPSSSSSTSMCSTPKLAGGGGGGVGDSGTSNDLASASPSVTILFHIDPRLELKAKGVAAAATATTLPLATLQGLNGETLNESASQTKVVFDGTSKSLTKTVPCKQCENEKDDKVKKSERPEYKPNTAVARKVHDPLRVLVPIEPDSMLNKCLCEISHFMVTFKELLQKRNWTLVEESDGAYSIAKTVISVKDKDHMRSCITKLISDYSTKFLVHENLDVNRLFRYDARPEQKIAQFEANVNMKFSYVNKLKFEFFVDGGHKWLSALGNIRDVRKFLGTIKNSAARILAPHTSFDYLFPECLRSQVSYEDFSGSSSASSSSLSLFSPPTYSSSYNSNSHKRSSSSSVATLDDHNGSYYYGSKRFRGSFHQHH